MTPILITGCAGFIGYHAAARLLREGHEVVGADNLSDYYDVGLKEARLRKLRTMNLPFAFERLSVSDQAAMRRLFERYRPSVVIHLAAQPGVRHSLEHPHDYVDANVTGLLNVLEGCRAFPVRHLLFASSSSVYGTAVRLPSPESAPTDQPVSFYAATKKAGELMVHSYAHLFGIPSTGLRFFTVYGPWGRPDMAYFSFARAMAEGRPIRIFGGGSMMRDFTYIDDAVESIVRLMDSPPSPSPSPGPEPVRDSAETALAKAPYRIFNVGNRSPVSLLDFVAELERQLGVHARKEYADMQQGDVRDTFADTGALRQAIGFAPDTPLAVGLARFVDWFRAYASGSDADPGKEGAP